MDELLAERLQELRKEKGFSQEELADRLNVSRQAISKWECGTALPDTENLIALAKLYDCSIDSIVFGSECEHTESVPEKSQDGSKREYVSGKILGAASGATVFVCAIVYVLCGTLLGKWGSAWVIFFALPIVPTLIESIAARNMQIFCFPCLVAAIYTLLGCEWGLWHPWWVMFFSIPIYYSIGSALDRDND